MVFSYDTLPNEIKLSGYIQSSISSYEQTIEKEYGEPLLNKIYSIVEKKKLENHERFSLSTVLINLVSDSLEEDNIDFKRLKNRFEDIVFNSLSLLDDYLYENDERDFFEITDSKYYINNTLSHMILSNISIHPSAWGLIGKNLIADLDDNLKRFDKLQLQRGYLTLINNKIFIKKLNKKKLNKKKSDIKIIEL